MVHGYLLQKNYFFVMRSMIEKAIDFCGMHGNAQCLRLGPWHAGHELTESVSG